MFFHAQDDLGCCVRSPIAELPAAHSSSTRDRMADEAKDGEHVITVALRELPEALDRAVYVHERWPLVVDPTGQAARFLKYQRGSFLCTRLPGDMVDTNLRRALVGALRYASFMTIDVRACRGVLVLVLVCASVTLAWVDSPCTQFGDDTAQNIGKYFSAGHFPEEAMSRSELYKEEVWAPLLRTDEGDPSQATFLPRDEFKVRVKCWCAQTTPVPLPRCLVFGFLFLAVGCLLSVGSRFGRAVLCCCPSDALPPMQPTNQTKPNHQPLSLPADHCDTVRPSTCGNSCKDVCGACSRTRGHEADGR